VFVCARVIQTPAPPRRRRRRYNSKKICKIKKSEKKYNVEQRGKKQRHQSVNAPREYLFGAFDM